MKVIHQLIAYFRARGALTESQLAYLRRQGFWPDADEDDTEDAPADVGLDPTGAPAASQHLAFPVWEGDPPPRWARPGPPTSAAPAAIDVLCRRPTGLTAGWDEPLHSFVVLARRLRPCTSWEQAAVVLRSAGIASLTRALRDGLDAGAITLGALARALDLQDYRVGVVQPDDRSPAASAWRALLTVPDWRASGKHAWILRHPPMDRVFNLVQAKQAVLGALADLYRADGE